MIVNLWISIKQKLQPGNKALKMHFAGIKTNSLEQVFFGHNIPVFLFQSIMRLRGNTFVKSCLKQSPVNIF